MKISGVFSGLMAAALGITDDVHAQHNVLTPAEVNAGYIQLFNGSNLSNWKSYNSTTPPASWIVQQDGDAKAIVVTSGGVGHLISKQNDFQNFDLKIEWKVPLSGNSGIFIRYLEIDAWGGASGPEAQVVDINNTDGKQTLHRAGTCYDMIPLLPGRDNWWKPTGEWNQFRIVAYNSKVAHYGNGKKLLEYDMTSKTFNDAYILSKYNRYPQYKTVHPGAIYLQHHGETGIKYRNIRIKKLDRDPWESGSPYLKSGGGLIDSLALEDNIFPTPVTAIFQPDVRDERLRFLREYGNVAVVFPVSGEYLVRLSDLQGRINNKQMVRGDRWIVPSKPSGSTVVLSISRDGRTIHRGILPAP